MKSTFNIHAGNDLEADILKSTNMKSPKARFVLALGTSPLPVHAQLHPTLFKSRRGGIQKGGVHTKISTLLPQRAPFLPEDSAEVSLIHMPAPKPAAQGNSG